MFCSFPFFFRCWFLASLAVPLGFISCPSIDSIHKKRNIDWTLMSLDNNSLVNVRFCQPAIFYFILTCFPEEQRKFQHTNILFIF
jgi:hypothetical protein